MRPIILWGGTGHARVLRDLARQTGREVVAVFDRTALPAPWQGVPIFEGREGFAVWAAALEGAMPGFAVAIGGARGADRLEIAAWLADRGARPETLVHPAAVVEPSATLAAGSQVLAGAVIGAAAEIGAQAIVNTRASVDHDCRIGEGAHIAPGATLCGEVRVGPRAMIGAGAVVLPRIAIGDDAIVGAGAVVTHDVPPGVLVTGVPARPRE